MNWIPSRKRITKKWTCFHFHYLLSLLLLCGLCTCKEGKHELAPQHKTIAIINGQVDTEHPAVGKIASNSKVGLCTGTLIGTKTVITTAHCITEKTATYTFELGGITHAVAQLIIHSGYSIKGSVEGPDKLSYTVALNDLGLMILAEEITAIEPMEITGYPISIQDELVVVGFGRTQEGNPDSAGIKHVGKSKISYVGREYFMYGMGIYPAGCNICYGDSGGPTFYQEAGQELLLGVHSSGDCVEIGYDMRVGYYYDWIISQAAGNVPQKDIAPPLVTISKPADKAEVDPSFSVQASAQDDRSGVVSLELFIDGQSQGKTEQSPALFSVSNAPEGERKLVVAAVDGEGHKGTASITVLVKSKAPLLDASSDAPPPITNSDTDEGGCAVIRGSSTMPSLILVLLFLAWKGSRR